MGFFFTEGAVSAPRGKKGQPSTQLLHEFGCKICPLNHADVQHPKMEPTGSLHPDVYIIGEAPGKHEDEQGKQFVGESGDYLRPKIPKEWRERIRWSNVIHDRPPNNRTPEFVEIEACRPRLVADIERTQPRAVFGFGGVPLQWATNQTGIANWRGRIIPINVGSHSCWFFPFHHPAFLLRARRAAQMDFIEDERMFAFDLKRAFAALPNLPLALPHSKALAMEGVEVCLSGGAGNARRVIAFLEWAAQHEVTGVDFETPTLRPYTDPRIFTVAIAAGARSLAFPLDHPGAGWSAEDYEKVLGALLAFFQAPNVRKAVHNLAFEQEWIAVLLGRDLLRSSRWDDTMSQAFVLDQRVGSKSNDDENGVMECFGLGFLTMANFGLDIKTLSSIDRKNIAEMPLSELLPYNAVDAKYHKLLCEHQDDLLEAEGLTDVYEMHLRRISTVVLTQVKGVPLDQNVSIALHDDYTDRIAKTQAAIRALPVAREFHSRTGRKFNPASNPDMVIVCRDILKSDAGAGKLGAYTVNEAALSKIKHPIIKLVLELRGLTKLDSTYVWAPGHSVVHPDGMLHPLLNTVRARTSRLSSSEPNEQNMPKREEEAKEIRRQIKARKGYVLAAFDQGQIEARVFAMASRDKRYTDTWWEGFDIHMHWAKLIADAYPAKIGGRKFLADKDVMKALRQEVKSVWVFALLFGARLRNSAERLSIPEQNLRPLYDKFWQEYSGLADWHRWEQKFYQEHGYVELLTGRRRSGPLSYNQVINTPIQGTMAEIILDGMNRVSELDVWEVQPIMNVHDDLTFELPEPSSVEFEPMVEMIVGEMLRFDTFDFINVPLMVEMSIGENLCDMTEVAKFSSVEWWGHKRAA